MAQNLDLLLFLALCGLLLLGYPVTFTLAGLAVLFAGIGVALDAFDLVLLGALAQRTFGIMTNDVLLAIPLFVFMGVVLERSRIAEELLEEMGHLFGGRPGGLAVSVMLVGALLAASTGIVGATVVTMAMIALPTMLRHGYAKGLAAGSVCTAGTLGQIIPPSTMLIILAEVMSTAFQQAQYAQGLFSIRTISVGQVFAAALVPGFVLVVLYVAFILLVAAWRPRLAPAMPYTAKVDIIRLLAVLVPPIVLIVAVLGSILGGIATPTEAAAVGAVGALMLAGLRLSSSVWTRAAVVLALVSIVAMLVLTAQVDLRLGRTSPSADEVFWVQVAAGLTAVVGSGILVCVVQAWRLGVLVSVVTRTMTITSMIFATIIGASLFALVFRGLGGDARIEGLLTAMPGGPEMALLFVMLLVFLLGFFLDFVEISIILLPITTPALLLMGIDPIWLAVLIAINLQTSFLTPPFGFSLFYLRGAAPPEVTTVALYRGVIPFILLNLLGILVIYLFPPLATWLPGVLF
ncbi:MAG: TRAP transporter large permease [Pseudomonadota bacterium]